MYINSSLKNIDYVFGKLPSKPNILKVFDPMVIDFYEEISKSIINDKNLNNFPDLKTFGFWCRKRNFLKLSNFYKSDHMLVGRGIIFHVTPSNVAMNFLYSLTFGLLSGNANIVRLPSREFEQIRIIIKLIKNIFKLSKFKKIKENICLIRYEKNDFISSELSKFVNTRIIWGGDQTITQFKKYNTIPKCLDIMFSNRYSLSIINLLSLADLNDEIFNNLIENFFKDTYLMDQQGCSSPHTVVWLGKNHDKVKKRFWKILSTHVDLNYKSDLSIANEKYFDLALTASQSEISYKIDYKKFNLVKISVENNFKEIQKLKSKFGVFCEVQLDNIEQIVPLLRENVQTITYFGIEKKIISKLITNYNLLGVDRIVPIGRAFDMGLIWDGYDLIRSCSRIVEQ